MRWVLTLAWHVCPSCGQKMGTNDDGVETCGTEGCPYNRGKPT